MSYLHSKNNNNTHRDFNTHNPNTSTNFRSKTLNTFRLNSEFSFKDKHDSHNNSASKQHNQTQKGNFVLKIKVDKSIKGIENIVNKYSLLKQSNDRLGTLQRIERLNENQKDEEISKL